MGKLVKFFDSEWSYAKLKLPNSELNHKHTCAFTPDSGNLIVTSSDGMYYVASIDKSGTCKIVEQ